MRILKERFEDKPDVTEAVLFDLYGDGGPLYKEAQVEWPGLEPLDLKLKILRENGAGVGIRSAFWAWESLLGEADNGGAVRVEGNE